MKKLVFLLLLAPFFVQAQTADVSPADITNIVNFTTTPETPGPNTNVTVTLEASGIDLNASTIIWRLNGSPLKSGQGVTQINFETGGVGQSENLSVDINKPDGTSITRELTLTPGSVELIWQGNTYAPPFYKGRTWWTYQSRITLLAIPHIVLGGKAYSSKNLSYRWSEDGDVVGSSSGVGKNSFSFIDSVLSLPRTVSVDVMTDQDTVAGTASVTLNPVAPFALVYEDNPLYGVLFNREIGSGTTLANKEITFTALPMFMSGTSKDSVAFSYNWTTNGQTSQKGPRVTYRAPDDASGSTQVGVDILNSHTVTQSASKNFLVQFGNQNTL